MKKIIKACILVMVCVISLAFSSVYAVEAEVQINGEIIDFTDAAGNKVNAQLINSRTMVPLRKIFEVLGCDILWDNDTRTVTATKQGKEIVLQINNKIAKVSEFGKTEEIKLDSAPVIVNNRTLVPLRFIAESLDKQVGWDSSTYTAIIIDYDYFTNLIKQKNALLHDVLSLNNTETNFDVTREYVDKDQTANNNIAKISGSIIKSENTSNVTINFEGDNELISEIKKEGWGNFTYDQRREAGNLYIKTQNSSLNKMLNLDSDNYNEINAEKLDLAGDFEADLSKAIAEIFDISDNKLNVNTFNKMKTDFTKFVNLFVGNGTRTISFENADLNMFDYSKFDNIVYGNELSTTLSFINKSIFNYDVIQDDFLYDWNSITYNMNCESDVMLLKITLENIYNEKVNYTITCKVK